MANKVLTLEDLKNAIALYDALPSATLFRGLTGYGLVVDQNDQEIIAEVSSAKAIWKPMYLVISGGRKHGREKLSAEMIQLCIEEFKKNSLWAVLKSTSGYGLRLDGNGMVELVEAQQATTPINFEISHFGGRSILPMLSVQLGRIVSQEIEWKGGFACQNEHNRPVKAGDLLVLNRLIAADDLEVERILSDVTKEANRLSMMNTDGNLPRVHDGGFPMMQIFLRQELTSLVQGSQLERQSGFDYTIRQDGIEVKMRLLPYQTSSAEIFETAFAAFQKECVRVQMLYCQPLSESQRKKAGKPSNEVFGPADIQWLSWQKASRGDGVIAFHPHAPRRHDAVFPTEGWEPKEGERRRVLCLHKGNGFTGFPAPPAYIERYVQKDDHIASLQLVLVNFDGREKVVSETDVPLSEKWEWINGKYYSARAEFMEGNIWIVEETRGTWQLRKERVNETGHNDINGKPVTAISSPISDINFCPSERRFKPEQIFIRPKSLDCYATNLDPNLPDGWKIYAKGINPDGKEVTAHVNKEGASDVPFAWEEIPEEIRQQHLNDWPVCACGRQRYERAKFAQCELCRDYRSCSSCGKETRFMEATIKAAKREKLYCRDCRVEWVDRWEVVNQHITISPREEMAAEANLLLSGEVITGEEANNLLREKGWDCSAYTVILVGAEYRASFFSVAELHLIAALPCQEPKEFLQTVEMVIARKDPREDDFYRAVYDLANPSDKNILSEFLAEVPAPVEIKEEPQKIDAEVKLEPEPIEIPHFAPTLATSGFQYSSGRDFQCPKCNCFQRVTKSELKAYQAGEKIKITCVCGHSDFVQAEVPADVANVVADGNLDLANLAKAWDARIVQKRK